MELPALRKRKWREAAYVRQRTQKPLIKSKCIALVELLLQVSVAVLQQTQLVAAACAATHVQLF
jgi:hypothetical protein